MKAIECYEVSESIAKESGDTSKEGRAYGQLGNVYCCLGDFKKAADYQERCLKIAKEMKNRSGEESAYDNLGSAYNRLGDFEKALDCHKNSLKIAKEQKSRYGQQCAFGNLGSDYFGLGDFRKAIYYNEQALQIAKEIGDRSGEGMAYLNLGANYSCLRNFTSGLKCEKRALTIFKEQGNMAEQGFSYSNLGRTLEEMGLLNEAVNCYQSSVSALNDVRARLYGKEKWKISLRDMQEDAYTALWRVMLKLDRSDEALCAAEKGRAQALNDLLESKYGMLTAVERLRIEKETIHDIFDKIKSTTVFLAFHEGVLKKTLWITQWFIQSDKSICRREKEVCNNTTRKNAVNHFEKLVEGIFEDIGVKAGVNCEDRSLENLRKPTLAKESFDETRSHSLQLQNQRLRKLYDAVIDPIANLIIGDEIIIVPDGSLWLAPYAAFVDSSSKYLSESFRIRVIPSLTSLELIVECQPDYHSKSGALIVGDPWVQEVVNDKGQTLEQLPCAREEVEMIGRILNTPPLTKTEATKNVVLKRLSSVALVHIAAHGRMETGEIALSPNPLRKSGVPKDEDFLLEMSDVLGVKLRARLVVLSCCHSGRGDIKAEGVVGIARAFLGAGARSVLVSLWAIDDEATLEFMKHFYQHLTEGKSASKALNQTMKSMRESVKFSEVKYWAPFVLVGDDVTLEFDQSE